tara:strand:+ start:344655 stop:345209 length:555 start_codon:yes stop_codon:yes gene_type:complete
MKLYGSIASPFVRRIRLLIEKSETLKDDYEFIITNIFDDEQSAIIEKLNPTKRIPLLVDGDKVIWDSLLIAEYLIGEFDIKTKKDIVLLNEATDAGVCLFQLRKFDIDANDEGIFSKNNLKRIALVLDYFETKLDEIEPIVKDWLFCSLDWFKFRDVYQWQDTYPKLNTFYQSEFNKYNFNPRE